MVSFKEATKPVRPLNGVIEKASLQTQFKTAETNFEKKRWTQVAKIYHELVESISSSTPQDIASKHAMESNSLKMLALKAIKEHGFSPSSKQILEKAKLELELALKEEPYWSEYLQSKGKLEHFIHNTFGCRVVRKGKVWETNCYKVSRALGLPGSSIGATMRFECSICGKDPIDCPHILGKIYDGRLALAVAKDIEFDHIALVRQPLYGDTYIFPHPLTEADIRRLFPPKIAEDVINGKKELTCKDLLKVIKTHHVRGIDWGR